MQGYLDHLPKIQSERIVELLLFPEGTVGGIMTNDIVFRTHEADRLRSS